MNGSRSNVQNSEEIGLDRTEVRNLLRHVAKFREKVVSVFGVDAPESASLLIDMLAQTEDPILRSTLYGGAVTECLLQGCLSAAERIAVARHEEFQDILSLMSL